MLIFPLPLRLARDTLYEMSTDMLPHVWLVRDLQVRYMLEELVEQFLGCEAHSRDVVDPPAK